MTKSLLRRWGVFVLTMTSTTLLVRSVMAIGFGFLGRDTMTLAHDEVNQKGKVVIDRR